MSKQAEAKTRQVYRAKPVNRMCSNCRHFTSEEVRKPGYGESFYTEERNLRCSIGEFKVMKTATCDEHDWIEKE